MLFLYIPSFIRLGQQTDRTINVYMFTEFLSPEAIHAFEVAYGIKVIVQYYESNEELYAKFKINNGSGYDIITPSDYMIEYLKKDGLLQKIDYTKMQNARELDSRLLHHYFDQNNEYSVPLTWSVYGIIYDKHNMTNSCENVSWDLIFKNPYTLFKNRLIKKPYKICIFDDPRDVILIASYYLFRKIHNITQNDLIMIEQLLIDQKRWVECYTNFGLRYFLEGNIIACALTLSRYAHHILDVDNGRYGFKIPKEGSFLVIENFAIPSLSTKAVWAHKFINFMISYKYCIDHFKLYGGNPVNYKSYQLLKSTSLKDLQFFPNDDSFEKLLLMHNEIPTGTIEDLWLRVKTA